MQLSYEQLIQQLKNQPLVPIYLISGEEIVLVQTACSAIRIAAKKAGFFERQVFYVDTHFNWCSFTSCMNNYELFAEKQLLELHLPHGISEVAAQHIQLYAKDPSPNKQLLIITGKIDRRLQQSIWFKSINKVGLFVPVWPMQASQLFKWITERFHTLGLKAEKAAIEYLMFATEGNLVATEQTIEKLNLTLDEKDKFITTEILTRALNDSARFDPFKLTDAVLAGKSQRCLRILAQLKEEEVEPLLILWALSRECRQLARFSFELEKGSHLTTLFKQQGLWEKRQILFQQALARHPLSHWYKLLGFAADIDQLIKGIGTGNVWNALQALSIEMAGHKYL